MLSRTSNPIHHGKRRSLKPDYIADSVLEIDFDYLVRHGIKAALIDLDGTVVPHGSFTVTEELSKHLHEQPLKIYIATNRPKSRSLKNLKEALNAAGVIHPHKFYGKPLPQYYERAARDHNLKPGEVVMIGDRYLQDIFGANLAGFSTIVVRKLDEPVNVFDALLARLEARYTDKLVRYYYEAVN